MAEITTITPRLMKETVLIDEPTALVTYIGKAKIGSSESAAVWQIMKISKEPFTTVTAIQWADGDTGYNNVWDDRASLTYTN